jgi:CubicO group peptidase (beta-lactamase class C family)
VAVAQLVEQGKLTYGDTVAQHFPDVPIPAAERITIHQLLTHLSGIGSYWNQKFEMNRVNVRSVSDFLDLFIDQPLVAEPGERWFYSNGGFVILGVIIERLTGKSYYEVIDEAIHKPAGMQNTGAFEVDRPIPNLAVGYTHVDYAGLREIGDVRTNLLMHVVKGGPGGGGFSTVEDLIRFDDALRHHRLITAEAAEEVLRGKVELRGSELQYAYGIYDQRINGQRVANHSGTFPGIGAQFDLYLDSGYTAAILSNVDPAASRIVVDMLRDRLTRG